MYRIRFRSDPYYFAGPRSEKIFVLETDPDLHPDPTYWLLSWKFRFRELTSWNSLRLRPRTSQNNHASANTVDVPIKYDIVFELEYINGDPEPEREKSFWTTVHKRGSRSGRSESTGQDPYQRAWIRNSYRNARQKLGTLLHMQTVCLVPFYFNGSISQGLRYVISDSSPKVFFSDGLFLNFYLWLSLPHRLPILVRSV